MASAAAEAQPEGLPDTLSPDAEEAMLEAEDLFFEGVLDAAEDKVVEVLASHPANREALLLLWQLQTQQLKDTAALGTAQRLASLPGDGAAAADMLIASAAAVSPSSKGQAVLEGFLAADASSGALSRAGAKARAVLVEVEGGGMSATTAAWLAPPLREAAKAALGLLADAPADDAGAPVSPAALEEALYTAWGEAGQAGGEAEAAGAVEDMLGVLRCARASADFPTQQVLPLALALLACLLLQVGEAGAAGDVVAAASGVEAPLACSGDVNITGARCLVSASGGDAQARGDSESLAATGGLALSPLIRRRLLTLPAAVPAQGGGAEDAYDPRLDERDPFFGM